MSKVDIVIPCHELYGVLGECIESVLETKSHNPNTFGQVILVDDDSSSEGTLEEYFSDKYPDVKYVRNPKRMYFSGTVNHGSDYVTSKYFMMLNSDTLIETPNWLEVMVEEYNSDDKIKIISANFNDRKPYFSGGPFVCGVCLMMEIDLFRQIGKLKSDGKFIHWHSDKKLQNDVRRMGYLNALSTAKIKHLGGRSREYIPNEIRALT